MSCACREVAVAGAVKSAVGDRSDEGADLDDPAEEIDPDVLKQVKYPTPFGERNYPCCSGMRQLSQSPAGIMIGTTRRRERTAAARRGTQGA